MCNLGTCLKKFMLFLKIKRKCKRKRYKRFSNNVKTGTFRHPKLELWGIACQRINEQNIEVY